MEEFFSKDLPSVFRVSDDLDYSLLKSPNKNPEVMFVFPERMLPLQRAYFVRGFDLLLGMVYEDISVAVVLFGPNNSDLDKIKCVLGIFSPVVFATPLKRGAGYLSKAIRYLENKLLSDSGK